MDQGAKDVIARIEAALARDATRNAAALAPYVAGNLAGLAASLLSANAPHIAIVSGFWIQHAKPPAAETDGPIGAALLARLFIRAGWRVSGLTDAPCAPTLRAAFEWAGIAPGDIFIAGADEEEAWLKARGATHLISIERPGRAADGRYYNRRGKDISERVHPFDDLFAPGKSWVTGAIGDGGNEIGMGSIPRDVIARAIDHGKKIASTTASDFTIVCGVSNWGAYGLSAALAALSPEFQQRRREIFTDACELEIMRRVIETGAVDGVLGRAELSVDGMAMASHFAKRAEIDRLIGEPPAA
jgi:hypothetical protein